MKKIITTASILLTLLITGCVPQTVMMEVKADYLTVSVPEEGGINLIQYTRDEDNVVYPNVVDVVKYDGTKTLNWYAAPLIAVSNKSNKLAYLGLSNGYHNLYIKDITGGRTVVQRTFNRIVYDMNFSPDDKYLAFTEDKGGNTNIYMINANEGVAVQQMVATDAGELSPCFTPDGKTIIYAKNEGNNYGIWGVNIASSLITQYTEGFTPSLFSNGESVVVTRNSKDGQNRGEIWMINLKTGSESIVISDPKQGYSSPQISPNGNKIIFVGTTPKTKTKPMNLDLFVVNTDGTKLQQITFHGGNDLSPIWSKDGKSIFFLSQRGNIKGSYNVWKMNITEQ